jgi:O-methyltransferase domain
MEDEDGPAADLWERAALVTPMAIRVAATLRVADHIAAGVRTSTELARLERVDADALDRVLRHLVSVGVLTRDGEGRYSLPASGEALRDDHPSGTREALDLEGAVGRAELAFTDLLHSVRTGEAAFPVRFGRSFWDDLSADPGRAASYASQMGSDVAAWAPAILVARDWGSLGHVVDVGGGGGSLMVALLQTYPRLRVTVVDLPEPVEAARATLGAAGLADRGEAVVGSFFDALPPDAGAYLLCAILHDWNDEAARAILRRCAEAAGSEGLVFVVEKVGPDGESVRTEMDLRMLAYFGGRERGVAEIGELAADAGLRLRAVHPAGDLSIVELSASGSPSPPR